MRVSDVKALSREALLDVIVADAEILVLRGELDMWTAELLSELLDERPDLGLTTIDASGLTFIDLSGARALAGLVERTGRGRVLAGETLRYLDGIVPLDQMTPHGLTLE